MTQLRTLYPAIEPYDTGRLKVSDVHEIYYEQCGNPNGKPVVFLHGGPGGGLVPEYRQFHDPAAYRIVLLISVALGRARHTRVSNRIRRGISWQTLRSCASIWVSINGKCSGDRGAAR